MSPRLKPGQSGNPQKRAQAELPPPPTRTELVFSKRWVQYSLVAFILAGTFGSFFALLAQLTTPASDKQWLIVSLYTVICGAIFLFFATYVVDFIALRRGKKAGRQRDRVDLIGGLRRVALVVFMLIFLASTFLSVYQPPVEAPPTPAPNPYPSLPLFPDVKQSD